jgi:hypothetical protein
MTNGHDKPVVLHPLFATTFNQVFGEPTPKKAPVLRISRRVGKRRRRGGMMNREIKFRAWKESEKRMVGWGELLCRDGSSLLGDVLTGVYLKAVMQYTGLKDKNGKEIYEGDYLSNGIDGHKWEIQWAIPEDYCGWVAVNGNGTRELFLNKHFINSQIIGNIYES